MYCRFQKFGEYEVVPNEYRFNGKVESTRATGTGSAHYKGYDWQNLGPVGTLIDVGGGIGAAAYAISTHLPEWKVVVQDLPEIIQAGKQVSTIRMFCR